jgi:hypothetical protein
VEKFSQSNEFVTGSRGDREQVSLPCMGVSLRLPYKSFAGTGAISFDATAVKAGPGFLLFTTDLPYPYTCAIIDYTNSRHKSGCDLSCPF